MSSFSMVYSYGLQPLGETEDLTPTEAGDLANDLLAEYLAMPAEYRAAVESERYRFPDPMQIANSCCHSLAEIGRAVAFFGDAFNKRNTSYPTPRFGCGV